MSPENGQFDKLIFSYELDGLDKYLMGAITGFIMSSWRGSRRFCGANVLEILS